MKAKTLLYRCWLSPDKSRTRVPFLCKDVQPKPDASAVVLLGDAPRLPGGTSRSFLHPEASFLDAPRLSEGVSRWSLRLLLPWNLSSWRGLLGVRRAAVETSVKLPPASGGHPKTPGAWR